jgi:anti-sigma factor RsiW
MEHINDNELLEHVAGRLTEVRSRQLREHMAECPGCEKRYREAVDVWDSLGRWRVDPSGHEIADHIEAFAAENESGRRTDHARIIPFIRSFPAAIRVAAAILLAIGAGHFLGRYGQSRSTPDAAVSQEGPRYVAALGFEWSSELTWTVLDEEAAPAEVNQ